MKNHKVLEDGRTIEMTKNIHCKSRESLRAAIIKDDINSDPSLSMYLLIDCILFYSLDRLYML